MTANADRTDPGPVRAGLNFNDCSDIPISSAHSTDASIRPGARRAPSSDCWWPRRSVGAFVACGGCPDPQFPETIPLFQVPPRKQFFSWGAAKPCAALYACQTLPEGRTWCRGKTRFSGKEIGARENEHCGRRCPDTAPLFRRQGVFQRGLEQSHDGRRRSGH